MGIYKVSSRLLFTVLLSIKDLEKKNPVNYTMLNKKMGNKCRPEAGFMPRKLDLEYIRNLTNCVGNAIFKKNQEIYYTKLENLYPLFYCWQSTLKYECKSQDLWAVLCENLKKNNHLSDTEVKRFSVFKDKCDFEKAVYKAYKKMTWAVFSDHRGK